MQSTSSVPAPVAANQQLSFDILNQPTGQTATQNVIYITDDASFNKITLQIMLTSGSVKLLPGTITAPPTPPTNGSVLYLDLSGLQLSSSVWDGLELSADGWTFEKFAKSVVGIAPTKSTTLSAGASGALSITVSNLEIPAALSTPSATLYMTYYGVPGVTGMFSSFQVAIVNSPANKGELSDDLSVNVSSNAIVNSSNSATKTSNSFILQFVAGPDGTTVNAGAQTVFNVSFVYGRPGDDFGYGALTDVTNALNIRASRELNADHWSLTENTEQQSPSWTLGPPEGPILGSGEQAVVGFTFDKIVTNYQPGPTLLLVSYANVPGYNDGTFTIVLEKIAHVYINSLTASPDPAVLSAGKAKVNLSWVASAPSLTLMPGEFDVSGLTNYTPEISDTTTFMLIAEGQQIQNRATADIKVDILPLINSINSEPQNVYLKDFPHDVLLDWNVDTTGTVILSNSVNSETETFPAASTTGESVAGPQMFTLTPQDDTDLLISRNEVISAFQLASQSVTLPNNPLAVAVAPTANLYAVVQSGSDPVVIMESITNQSYGPAVAAGKNPACVMFSPNGEYLYVGNQGDKTLSVIGVTFNSTSNSYEFNKIKDVSLSGAPNDLDVASDDSYIFVTTNGTAGNLDIVKNAGANNFFVKTTIEIGTSVDGVAVLPSVGQAFVASAADAQVSVVGYSRISDNFELVGTINGFESHDSPCDVAIAGQDSSTLLIACKGSNSVYAVNKDVTSVSGKQKLSVGQTPVRVITIEEGSYAYVANSGDTTVSLISCFKGSGFSRVLESALPAGASPGSLAASPDGAIIYVANTNAASIQILNEQTYTDGGAKSSVGLATNVAASKSWVVSWHNFDNKISLTGTQPGPGLSIFERDTEAISVVNPTTNYVDFKFWPEASLKRAFATISGDNSLHLLETDTFTTLKTISLGSSTTAIPVGISISQWGNAVFVLTEDTGGALALVVIQCDMKTDDFQVLTPVPLFTESASSTRLITSVSDGSMAFVSDSVQKKLYVVSKNRFGNYELESTTYSFILFPHGLVCSPDDSQLLVWMNEASQSAFAKFDIKGKQLENFVVPASAPFQVNGMTISPDGSRVFITDSNFGGIRVFSTIAMQNVENISLPEASFPMGLAIAPDASEIYTANAFSANFSIAQQLQPRSSLTAQAEVFTGSDYQGIFLRDYIGETPTSNTGTGWTLSPDIQPQFPNQLPDPTVLGAQANYNTDFSASVQNEEGKINFIYIRGLNTNNGVQKSRAYFYWVQMAVVLLPSQWSPFNFELVPGTPQNFLDITAQAQNDIAYSPSPLFWTPPTTFPHYCLVVWIDNTSTPSPPDLGQWATFASFTDVGHFIMAHPNMAWRNTNDFTEAGQFLNAATQVTGVTGGGQVTVGLKFSGIGIGVGNKIQFNLLNSDGSINYSSPITDIVTNTFSETINWPANAPTPTLIYTYTPVSGSMAGGEQILVFTSFLPPASMLKRLMLRHPQLLVKLRRADFSSVQEMVLGVVRNTHSGS